MLTDEEWLLVAPHLSNAADQIKRYREEHACSLTEATQKGFGQAALATYERLTGFKETNVNALFHHRLNIYGSPCQSCGKPFRTPRARHCANCSAEPLSDITREQSID